MGENRCATSSMLEGCTLKRREAIWGSAIGAFSTASVSITTPLSFCPALLFVDKRRAVNFPRWSGMDRALALKRRF